MPAPSSPRSHAVARIAVAFAVAFVALAPAAAAVAPRTSLPDVEDEVMCPVCGVPLNIAESPQADRERAFIQARIAAGDSKEEIKRKLAQQLGPAVLALPKSGGFNAAVYVVPIAVTLIAALAIAAVIARWRRGRADDATAGPVPELNEADARRLDEELARFDAIHRRGAR
jgi:cytochrome c-type biogenesis protein CcmH